MGFIDSLAMRGRGGIGLNDKEIRRLVTDGQAESVSQERRWPGSRGRQALIAGGTVRGGPLLPLCGALVVNWW